MAANQPAARRYSRQDADSSMLDRNRPRIQVVLAIVFVILAGIHLFDAGAVGSRIDSTVLLLVVGAGIVLVAPWQHLTSAKGGGFEFTWSVDTTQVQGAIRGIKLKEGVSEKLERELRRLREDAQGIVGSRILWVDDVPHSILGERRMLRALGIEITSAISSNDAERILSRDNDFDLIITDAHRNNEEYGGKAGQMFVEKLENYSDVHIRNMPVVFYAAYTIDELREHTKDARKSSRTIELTISVDQLQRCAWKLIAQNSQPQAHTTGVGRRVRVSDLNERVINFAADRCSSENDRNIG